MAAFPASPRNYFLKMFPLSHLDNDFRTLVAGAVRFCRKLTSPMTLPTKYRENVRFVTKHGIFDKT